MEKTKNKIKIKEENRIDFKDVKQDGEPSLRKISFEVSYPLSKKDKLIMHQMIDYVRSSVDESENKVRNLRPAYGISAPQIGYNKKLLYARVKDEFNNKIEEFALINPKITFCSKRKAYLSSGEGCLSVSKEYKGYVLRSQSIKILAIDYFTDREIEIEAKNLTAIVLQHEMDHLKGIMFYDRINKFSPFKIEDKTSLKI